MLRRTNSIQYIGLKFIGRVNDFMTFQYSALIVFLWLR